MVRHEDTGTGDGRGGGDLPGGTALAFPAVEPHGRQVRRVRDPSGGPSMPAQALFSITLRAIALASTTSPASGGR